MQVGLAGATGYAGRELLRLLAGHPHLRPAAVLSDSKPGALVEEIFPHLAGTLRGLTFCGRDALSRLVAEHPRLAVLGAAPHGASAAIFAELFAAADGTGTKPRCVDISADFRYSTAAAYEAVYKHPHGAPSRIA